LIFVIGVTAILAQDLNMSCPIYKCATSNLGDGNCISTTTTNTTDASGAVFYTVVSEVDTSVCKQGLSMCPPTQVDGKHQCTPITQGQTVDGEKCADSTKCYSGNCVSGVCKGLDNGQSCDDTTQCKIGDYCTGTNKTETNSTCQAQLQKDAVCKSRHDCINSMDCFASKCVPVFSLPDTTPIDVTTPAHICSSGYVYGGLCTQLTFMGAKGDYVTNGTDNKCNYTFTATGQVIPHPIGECGIDGSFTKYCYHPGTNSDVFNDQVNKLKAYYNGAALKKHSLLRDVYPSDVALAVAKVSSWPRLNNADKCATNLLSGAYSNSVFAKLSIFDFGLLFMLF